MQTEITQIKLLRHVRSFDPVSGNWIVGQAERWGQGFAFISTEKECFWCPTKRLNFVHESDQEKKMKKLQISDLSLDQNAFTQLRGLPTT